MKKKQRIFGVIIIVLMIISEVVMLLLQKNKLGSTKYNMLDISFNKIIIGEIVLFVIDLIFIIITMFQNKKFKTNLGISVALLMLSFLAISLLFYSYASFINAVLLIIYTNYLKTNETKNKIL